MASKSNGKLKTDESHSEEKCIIDQGQVNYMKQIKETKIIKEIMKVNNIINNTVTGIWGDFNDN